MIGGIEMETAKQAAPAAIYKRCSLCKEWKPITDFGHSKNSIDGHKYRCKKCVNAAQRAYYNKRANEVVRESNGKHKRHRKKYIFGGAEMGERSIFAGMKTDGLLQVKRFDGRTGYENPRLSAYTFSQLMLELYSRGFDGVLYFTPGTHSTRQETQTR